ncbi:unnamed protein product [Rhodiola kirilowii]
MVFRSRSRSDRISPRKTGLSMKRIPHLFLLHHAATTTIW